MSCEHTQVAVLVELCTDRLVAGDHMQVSMLVYGTQSMRVSVGTSTGGATAVDAFITALAERLSISQDLVSSRALSFMGYGLRKQSQQSTRGAAIGDGADHR